MSVLALPSEKTVFWLFVLVVALIVVVGVLTLIATLLYMVRSISLSVAQLRELTGAQAAAQVAQARAGQPQPSQAEPESPESESPESESPEAGSRSPGPAATGSPADDAPPSAGSAAGDGDERDSGPGRSTQE